MNRRQFVGTSVSSIAVATQSRAFAQDATPVQESTPVDQSPDLCAREIVTMLENVSPVTLLAALETATVSSSDAASLTPIPWQDFGDTDLYNSLGGVFIAQAGSDLNSPDTELYGGYVVYESAEIAYHELRRQLDALDANWTGTSAEGGTTHWYIDSDDMQIRIARIGYVILIALGWTEFSPIDHLHDVALALSQ